MRRSTPNACEQGKRVNSTFEKGKPDPKFCKSSTLMYNNTDVIL
jgi:hypothetical protein